MSEQPTKDVMSIGERLSYCQCATCLPCLARVEIERLTAERDQYKMAAKMNAETVKKMQQANDRYASYMSEVLNSGDGVYRP